MPPENVESPVEFTLPDTLPTIPPENVESPVEFTLPVKFPLKFVDAVMTPETLIFWGNLELFNVPLLILDALSPCKSVPNPLKLYAVIIPDALMSPVELNPTPELVLGLLPI